MNTATISGNDFLDILFNGRNKDYGAYDLRRKYDRRVRNAIIGTAAVTMTIIGGYALSNRLSVTETHILNKPVIDPVTLASLPPETKTPPPPALPSSTPPPVRPTEKFTTPVIARQNEVSPEDEPPPMEDLANKAVGLATSAGTEGVVDVGVVPEAPGTGVIEMTVGKEPDDPNRVFNYVELMPSFPGGDEALLKYLSRNIRYPNIAAENGIEGLVTVQFVVDYEGNIKDVKVLSAAKGGGLEQEATRVIKAMPKWKPGKQNGRYVSVLYSIPVNFRLSN
ncbi:MAG TPA: TonB family protein [Chitinophaga sp.]